MLHTTSEMLHHIHSLIEEYAKESWTDSGFFQAKKVVYSASDPVHNNYAPFFKKDEFRKMEERVVCLEQHNEQLIHIVHFLFERLSEVAKDQFFFPDSINEDLSQDHQDSMHMQERKNFYHNSEKDNPIITKRELEVFKLLTKGLCAKEIAKVLFISETTVITHKRNLKEKFNARNTVELISNVLSKNAEKYTVQEVSQEKNKR